MSLIIDDREKSCCYLLNNIKTKIDIKEQQLPVGDFIISVGEKLLCIERKTWTDLATSITDGRIHNLDKMLKYREQNNEQLIYIIEGTKPKTKIARIPIARLDYFLIQLMSIYQIFVIYTKDTQETVNRLIQLSSEENAEVILPQEELPVAKMWAGLTGISIVQGSILSKLFSVSDFVSGNITKDQIMNIQTVYNKPLCKRGIKSLLLLHEGKYKQSLQLLSNITGISRKTSIILLEKYKNIKTICQTSVEELSEVVINVKKIGNRAFNIKAIL